MTRNKNILKRFISDKFSFSDYLSVLSWFTSKEDDLLLRECMEEEWNNTDNSIDRKEKLAKILDLLHIQIKRSQLPYSKTKKFHLLFSKIAVSLFIPIFIFAAILSYLHFFSNEGNNLQSYTEIYAPEGTRAKFQLPDGTEGWLNSSSSIRFLTDIKTRKVEISGEVWFDVAHKDKKTFTVVTPYIDVQVLGTRFNVMAYEEEKTTEVILETGKVAILDKDKNVIDQMSPDQKIAYNTETRKLSKECVDAKSYNQWKDGLLIFKNVSMAEIARRLERKYNAEIILHGDSLKHSIFRATFDDERLDEICKLMSEVTPIKYKIHKRKRQDDGTFAKNKVEMWLLTKNE